MDDSMMSMNIAFDNKGAGKRPQNKPCDLCNPELCTDKMKELSDMMGNTPGFKM
jgi:hypothetical protein